MSVIYPSLLYGAQDPHSTNLYPNAIPNVGEAVAANQPLYGSLTFHGMVAEPVLSKPASLFNAVNWTFYNRILISPGSIELGNLLTAQTRVEKVWNGFLSPVNLTAFSHTNDDGIAITEPVTLPYVMRPLELLNYNLNISTEGPASISANYVWTIDGVDYAIVVSGRRAIVFPFPPNFRDDFTEVLEWKSDVLRAYDGSEQRRALRTKARRSFEYHYTLFNTDAQLLQNLMYGWQNRVFAMPVWSDGQKMTTDHAIGDTVINIDPTNMSFIEGDTAIIYKDSLTYEVVELQTVGSDLILDRGLENNWPVGSIVYPLIQAHIMPSQAVQRLTDTAAEGVINFITSPDVTDPYTPDAAAPVTYNGIEVVTTQTNWGDTRDNTFDFALGVFDNPVGAIGYVPTESYSRGTISYSWLLDSRQAITDFRSFLARRMGQVKPCWVPSWTDDFTVIADIGSSDTSISVLDNGYLKMFSTNLTRRYIMIRTTNGLTYYRQITGASFAVDGVNISLILNTPLGVAYPKTSIKTIHFLNLCRLATDKIEISWKTDRVTTVNTTFSVVPA